MDRLDIVGRRVPWEFTDCVGTIGLTSWYLAFIEDNRPMSEILGDWCKFPFVEVSLQPTSNFAAMLVSIRMTDGEGHEVWQTYWAPAFASHLRSHRRLRVQHHAVICARSGLRTKASVLYLSSLGGLSVEPLGALWNWERKIALLRLRVRFAPIV
jgi:hypothetical protein